MILRRRALGVGLGLFAGLLALRTLGGLETFQFYDRVQVRYTLTPASGLATNMQLALVGPAGTTVLKQGVDASGYVEVNGLVTNAAYELQARQFAPAGVTVVERVPCRVTPWVSGTLLANWLVKGPALPVVIDTVIIPAGLKLELQDFAATNSIRHQDVVGGAMLNGAGRFTGTGQLSLKNCELHGHWRFDTLDAIEIDRCHFTWPAGRLEISGPSRSVHVGNSVFLNNLTMNPAGYATIDQCEFLGFDAASGVRWAPSLGSALRGCIVTRNAFHGTGLFVPRTMTTSPRFEGNSFLGRMGFVGDSGAVTDRLAGNYWGGRRGPLPDPIPDALLYGWLDGFGGVSATAPVDFSVLADGPFHPASITTPRPFPEIWVQAQRIGQNVLPGVVRQGRAVLLCFDVRVMEKELNGAQLTLHVNDGAIEFDVSPEVPAPTLRRDYGDTPKPTRLTTGPGRTVEFIIPEWATEVPTLDWTLKLDATAVTGYATPGPRLDLAQGRIELSPGFGRALRVAVVPVNIHVGGYPPAPAPGSAGEVRATLENDLQTVWPLRSDEVAVELLSAFDFHGLRTSLPSRIWTFGLMSDLDGALNAFLQEYNAHVATKQRYDRIVGVVGKNALNSVFASRVFGATYPGSRASLVDESSPGAAIHELGHTFNLYLNPEEYDVPARVKNQAWFDGQGGMVVEGVTGFRPEAGLLDSNAFRGRYHHFPSGVEGVYDFMGAIDPKWAMPSTHATIHAALRALLGNAARDASLAGPPAAGMRRLFFQAAVQGEPDPTQAPGFRYRLLPGTITCSDETALMRIPVEDWLPVRASLEVDGLPYDKPLWNYAPGTTYPATVRLYRFTVDVPDTSRYVALIDGASQKPVFASLLTSLSAAVQGPAPGLLGDTVSFTWGNATGTTLPGITIIEGQAEHQVLYRANPTDPWSPLTPRFVANQIQLPTAALPVSDRIEFLLRTTRGLNLAETTLKPYRLVNRPPAVRLLTPAPGTVCDTNESVTLSATGYDPEDGTRLRWLWTSSLDGTLGTNAVLPDLRLRPGQHVLTVSARDAAGLGTEQSIILTVARPVSPDLALADADLTVTTMPRDPALGLDRTLVPGVTNRLTLTFRNQGVAGSARLRCFAQPAGSPELTWLDRTNDWAAFATEPVSFTFVPPPGTFRFRAQLDPLRRADGAVLTDPVPANNSLTWTFGSLPPTARGQLLTVDRAGRIEIVPAGFDPEGAPLTFRVTTPPTRGRLEGWTYWAPTNAPGSDAIEFVANDGGSDSPPARIEFTVIEPTAPIVVGADVPALVGEGVDFTPLLLFNPTQLSLQGLPAGLSADPFTGRITGRPAVAGTFTVKVTATNAAGSATGQLRILVGGQVTFAAWAAVFGLTGADAAPAADPDNDGLANLLEFAFKANPLLADAELGPHLEHRANGDVVIVYRQRTGGTGWVGGDYHAQGLTYAVQTSPTLTPADWQTTTNTLPLFGTGESLITRAPNGDGTETVSIPVRQPLSRSQLFLRLAVTPSGP